MSSSRVLKTFVFFFSFFFGWGVVKGSPWEEEPGKSGVGIAHVRLHPPPPPRISIFSLRRPRFSLIERSREIELRVSLTFRLASPKLTQPRLLIRESGEEDSRAVSYVKMEPDLRELRASKSLRERRTFSSASIMVLIKRYNTYVTPWRGVEILHW